MGFLLPSGVMEVQQLQADRRRMETDSQQKRLNDWKGKMKHADVKAVSRWLRRKENPYILVNVTHENQVVDNNVQAAAYIHRHWQLLWQHLEPLDEQAVATRMAAIFNQYRPRAQNIQWTPLDLKTFPDAILDSKGAAGCDSWSSAETRYYAVAAIQHLHQLSLRWHQQQQQPDNFVFSRQANLAKPHTIKDGLLRAEHTRPITVFSIFYRDWASAWTRTDQCRTFAASFPGVISGVYNHEGCEEAASWLQQELVTSKGTCVSLDDSQCYDRLRISLTTSYLTQVGWPQEIVRALQQIWPTQRHIEFDTRTSSRAPGVSFCAHGSGLRDV